MSKMDTDTFIDQVKTYTPNMYRLALGILQNRADAEDAVSEAVLKAYENLGALKKEERFRSWIMQITANEAKKLYNKARKNTYMESLEEIVPSVCDEHHELWDVVIRLEVIYREVILLYFYEQFSVKEIARTLAVAEGTVKSRLSRGKKLLRDMLEES